MTLIHFFSAPLGTYGNALVNWAGNPKEDLIVYAVSYRNAARNLVAFREGRGIGNIDHAVLPILFLYRHAFELYLKSIIFRAALVSINKKELELVLPKLWREHSLVALFEMARPVLKENATRPLTITGELEERIGWLASEIDQIDAGSYSFRYPVTSRGASAIDGILFTNIFVFSEHVESVLDDVSQFCHSLESERLECSSQMRLALHSLYANEP